jgi:hypothetical protein
VVAAASEPMNKVVVSVRALGHADGPKCVIVEGGDGSGKSIAATAFQAESKSRGVSTVLVHEGTEHGKVMGQVAAAGAVIVDNLDGFPTGLRRALFQRRHSAPGGTLLTVAKLDALERQLLSADDAYCHVGRWEDRPIDVLIIASRAWDDRGLVPGIADVCESAVAGALCRGLWARGAHSIQRAVDFVAEGLGIEGYFDRPAGQIEVARVLEAIVAVIREEQPPDEEDAVVIVVEGSTDVVYLQAAAVLAQTEWGSDLLAGCKVSPPGEDREGGAERAVRSLFRLEALGVTAVALFDDDEPGRAAAKDARKFSAQKVHLLPAEFDALGNPSGAGKTEIEDLVALSLVERFYAENAAMEPEERTVRGNRTRVVVAGPDKDIAAEWIAEHACFRDLRKLVYVLCRLRESVGLPLPGACPPLDVWLRELAE